MEWPPPLLLRPKGDERPLPILLQRTPYGVPERAQQSLIRGALKPMADDGYLFAFQDIRGRFGFGNVLTGFGLHKPHSNQWVAADVWATEISTLYYLCHFGMFLSWPAIRLLTAAACTVH